MYRRRVMVRISLTRFSACGGLLQQHNSIPSQAIKKSGNTSVLPLLYLFTVTSYVGMIQIRYTGPDGVSQISARFRRLPGTYYLFTLLSYYTTRKG